MTSTPSLNQSKVVLIEDNKGDQLLLKRILKRLGLTSENLQTATTAQGGMNVLQEVMPDIIFLDLMLPDSQGMETVQQLVEEVDGFSDAIIIVLSGLEDLKYGRQAVQLGAQDYIFKTAISEESLLKSIVYSKERKKNQQAIKKQKEALENYYRILAHDLKNPLSSLHQLSQLYFIEHSEESREDYLGKIRDISFNTLSFIESLLQKDQKPIDFNSLITQVWQDLSTHPNSDKISKTISIEHSLSPFYSRYQLLYSLLYNLSINSMHYMDSGKENSYLKIRTENNSKHTIKIIIEDNGTGIPKLEQKKIFEAYTRLNLKTKGTGIGLSIVKGILKRLNGSIDVTSHEGYGTIFSIVLPSYKSVAE